MVFCTEILDGWWPLRRSCVLCGWCRAKNTSIKLPSCVKLAFTLFHCSAALLRLLISLLAVGNINFEFMNS